MYKRKHSSGRPRIVRNEECCWLKASGWQKMDSLNTECDANCVTNGIDLGCLKYSLNIIFV